MSAISPQIVVSVIRDLRPDLAVWVFDEPGLGEPGDVAILAGKGTGPVEQRQWREAVIPARIIEELSHSPLALARLIMCELGEVDAWLSEPLPTGRQNLATPAV